jgi:hypothetical protein
MLGYLYLMLGQKGCKSSDVTIISLSYIQIFYSSCLINVFLSNSCMIPKFENSKIKKNGYPKNFLNNLLCTLNQNF